VQLLSNYLHAVGSNLLLDEAIRSADFEMCIACSLDFLPLAFARGRQNYAPLIEHEVRRWNTMDAPTREQMAAASFVPTPNGKVSYAADENLETKNLVSSLYFHSHSIKLCDNQLQLTKTAWNRKGKLTPATVKRTAAIQPAITQIRNNSASFFYQPKKRKVDESAHSIHRVHEQELEPFWRSLPEYVKQNKLPYVEGEQKNVRGVN
jgi:hypothetical protein